MSFGYISQFLNATVSSFQLLLFDSQQMMIKWNFDYHSPLKISENQNILLNYQSYSHFSLTTLRCFWLFIKKKTLRLRTSWEFFGTPKCRILFQVRYTKYFFSWTTTLENRENSVIVFFCLIDGFFISYQPQLDTLLKCAGSIDAQLCVKQHKFKILFLNQFFSMFPLF